jgi:hypothetical protein
MEHSGLLITVPIALNMAHFHFLDIDFQSNPLPPAHNLTQLKA